MYKPEILEGGRGWLLFLLFGSEAFYHAALALSAYHRRTIAFTKLSHPHQVAALVQQEKHLEVSIRVVNQHAQHSCPKIEIGIMAAVIQLVFFEVSLPTRVRRLFVDFFGIAFHRP